MLYLDNRPLAQNSPRAAHGPDRYFQWRGFFETQPEAVDQVTADYELAAEHEGTDQIFLLPGRADTITAMHDDKELEVRKIISTDGGIDQWEVGVKTNFPMKRVTAAMIGTYVPKFRGACSSAADSDYLADALSKKSRHHIANVTRRLFRRDKVRVRVEQLSIDGRIVHSVTLRSSNAETIKAELKRLGLTEAENMHLGTYLTA